MKKVKKMSILDAYMPTNKLQNTKQLGSGTFSVKFQRIVLKYCLYKIVKMQWIADKGDFFCTAPLKFSSIAWCATMLLPAAPNSPDNIFVSPPINSPEIIFVKRN